MILVAGVADESPVAAVIDALADIGANFRVFDQRAAAAAEFDLTIADGAGGGAIAGALRLAGECVAVEQITGIYLRLIDDQVLAEAAAAPEESPRRRHLRRLHELLLDFADIAPGRVLNRPSDMMSNMSKPFQAQIIRQAGFAIPETLITNDPAEARTFIERCCADGAGVIYKSISGVRSIVQDVTPADLARLDRIRWCPTQFQRKIEGVDVRVHVIGETAVAADIRSGGTDYRYASRQGAGGPTMTPIDLAPAVRARCVELAWRLHLPLAGIDLRRTPGGEYVCFEVNPSPAFTYYEQHAGVPIAAHIARYLAGM